MQVEPVWLSVALSQDLDEVMEVARLGRLELHGHLDGQAGCHRADVLVLAVEARVLRLGEHDAAHVLCDVPDGDGDLVVLVWLNI